jgi:hypothetical protein
VYIVCEITRYLVTPNALFATVLLKASFKFFLPLVYLRRVPSVQVIRIFKIKICVNCYAAFIRRNMVNDEDLLSELQHWYKI